MAAGWEACGSRRFIKTRLLTDCEKCRQLHGIPLLLHGSRARGSRGMAGIGNPCRSFCLAVRPPCCAAACALCGPGPLQGMAGKVSAAPPCATPRFPTAMPLAAPGSAPAVAVLPWSTSMLCAASATWRRCAGWRAATCSCACRGSPAACACATPGMRAAAKWRWVHNCCGGPYGRRRVDRVMASGSDASNQGCNAGCEPALTVASAI